MKDDRNQVSYVQTDSMPVHTCERVRVCVRVVDRPTINMEIPTAKYGKTTKNMEKYGKNTCYNEG